MTDTPTSEPKVTPSTPPPAKTAPAGNTSDQIVYVAEDDQFYAHIYEVKLNKDGFRVMVFGNGQELLDQVKKEKPCLILLDLMMPIKDGFDTLTELKADAASKDIPVIITSNLGQEEDISRAKSMGAVDYFVKTNISIQELVSLIRKYLPA